MSKIVSRRGLLAVGASAAALPTQRAIASMPSRPLCHIINESHLGAARCESIAAALTAQLHRDFCPAWRMKPMSVNYVGRSRKDAFARYPRTDLFLILTDEPSRVKGSHSQNKGRSIAQVFVRHIQAEGWHVSATASHELIEMIANPYANRWVELPWGGRVAFELCDPVQRDIYKIHGEWVQDFVYPAWFNAQARYGPFDHLGSCREPFQRALGGTWITK